jgi:hypothetical protein
MSSLGVAKQRLPTVETPTPLPRGIVTTTSEPVTEFLYDWLFTAKRFFLAPIPLTLTTTFAVIVLMLSSIRGSRSDFCSCQLLVYSCGASSLTRGRVHRLKSLLSLFSVIIFIAVKISSSYHPYSQFIMSAFYIVTCQEPFSLRTSALYSFTCNSSLYVCTIYTRLGLADQPLTDVAHITTVVSHLNCLTLDYRQA